MEARPLVSVVIAAYNRSNVLRLALESVCAQTYAEWEVWVVGDACTDDTEEVVAAFGDPRIHFVNLERNVGEQSGANNEGFRRARGRLVAYLGQDDLWLPDHLELCVRTLDETGADFVFSLAEVLFPNGERRLIGATSTGRYEPWVFTVPSTWLMRREVLEEAGPWRRALELYTSPQEDLLRRIARVAKRMSPVSRLTVVKLNSTDWPGSYASRDSRPQELVFRRMQEEPDFRERELTELARAYAVDETKPASVRHHVSRAARDVVKRALVRRGLPTYAVYDLVRFRRKGALLDELRRRRGLGPLERGPR